jgi:ADP-ribose pyrophosphatase YjhB (NUDIX family)
VTTDAVAEPVRVRVCAVLVHDGQVCLIRRRRETGLQHSLPGGLVEDGEDPPGALRRELLEELGLDLAALPAPPEPRSVQDQETPRPGESAPFLRRHLVFTAHLPVSLRHAIARTEQDDVDRAPVLWLPVADAAGLRLLVAGPGAVPRDERPQPVPLLASACGVGEVGGGPVHPSLAGGQFRGGDEVERAAGLAAGAGVGDEGGVDPADVEQVLAACEQPGAPGRPRRAGRPGRTDRRPPTPAPAARRRPGPVFRPRPAVLCGSALRQHPFSADLWPAWSLAHRAAAVGGQMAGLLW